MTQTCNDIYQNIVSWSFGISTKPLKRTEDILLVKFELQIISHFLLISIVFTNFSRNLLVKND